MRYSRRIEILLLLLFLIALALGAWYAKTHPPIIQY